MKNNFLLVGIITVIISCNTKHPDKTIVQTDTTGFVIKSDTANITEDAHYYWSAELDTKGILMKKTTPITADSLTAANMIQKLNELYPEIRLKYIRTSNDSMFLNIKNGTYLTQQMGSSGAEAYLAEVTYNLTELNGINYVDIKFKEGDHATPGTYARTDFIHAKK